MLSPVPYSFVKEGPVYPMLKEIRKDVVVYPMLKESDSESFYIAK